MKYKKNGFVGLHLREDKALIEYIIRAYKHINVLTDDQVFLLDKCFRILADNHELTKTTLEQLLEFFYYTLHWKPIEFQVDKKRGAIWGGWYDIPTKNRDLAAKRLHRRKEVRRQYVDEIWYREHNESFDWSAILGDPEEAKERAKEAIRRALGPDRIKEIRNDRDPRSAVIVPFKKTPD